MVLMTLEQGGSMTHSADKTMARPGALAVETAARAVLNAAAHGDSAFTPGHAVWTVGHVQELVEAFVNAPDASGATFDDKLAGQMHGVSDEAIQLFVELYYLDLLPLADYRGDTKRDRLERVLTLLKTPVSIPAELATALDAGVFGGGVAFKTRRYWQLSYLVQFARGFLAIDEGQRLQLLSSPLDFRSALDGWTTVNAASQRFALLYLVFPDFFLPIVKAEHRDLIRQSFEHLIAEKSGDPDDDLRRVYQALTEKAGGHIDLYQAPYREQWDSKAKKSATYLGASDKWKQFMHWAARFAAGVDLDDEERNYKVEMAARLDRARTELIDAAPGWDATLKSALNYGNLLHPRFKVSLFNDLRDQADVLRDALLTFWRSDPDPERLDRLRSDLRAMHPQSAYTPGNCTALGSVLLMARDVSQYPPYLPTPVARACELTGHPNDVGTPATRYTTLLELCQETLERAPEEGIELQDLLDAQGLVWAVVNYEPPESWSKAEADAFLAWRGASGDTMVDAPEVRRAWLVRGSSVNGRDLVPTWRQAGNVSLAATKLRPVDAGLSRDELKPIIDEDYSQASYAAKAAKVDEFHAFLTRMNEGDVVVTTSQGRLYLGRITGDPTYVDSEDGRSNLRRAVDWAEGNGVDYADLPSEVSARLQVQYEVVEMTEQLDLLEQLIADGPVPDEKPVIERELVFREADDQFARDLLVSRAWLQESIDLLRERRQLIYYGPPGTGKTYIALKLAEHVAGDNVRLVQFHPAYTYEDFFEGYRPMPEGGFALKPGPLRKIVDQAKENPSTPYFLIIDEINRGNLAKIFGELYFLLEYRDRDIDLLYATDDNVGFTLPKNVFIIGTMNTADRSIALVDSAMRRRFAFEALHPSSVPTAGLLRRWLKAEGHPEEAADLLDALNVRIEDPDFKIGPSYFMKAGGQTPEGIARVWRTAIMPLLEEHHYGDLTAAEVVQRYGLETIRARVKASGPSADVTAEPPVEESGAEAEGSDAPDPG
jgi:hypothetical protein